MVACDGLWNVFKMDEVAKFILAVVNVSMIIIIITIIMVLLYLG